MGFMEEGKRVGYPPPTHGVHSHVSGVDEGRDSQSGGPYPGTRLGESCLGRNVRSGRSGSVTPIDTGWSGLPFWS